jgi:hypothetical protein
MTPNGRLFSAACIQDSRLRRRLSALCFISAHFNLRPHLVVGGVGDIRRRISVVFKAGSQIQRRQTFILDDKNLSGPGCFGHLDFYSCSFRPGYAGQTSALGAETFTEAGKLIR